MPRYAVIDCEDEPKWEDEGSDDLWQSLLKEADRSEEWVVYRAYKGEIPTLDDRLDGVVIPGSHYSVYENLPWMQDLKAYVRSCVIPWGAHRHDPAHARKPQIVGSCFGHQLIADALGGHVAPNPRGKYIVKAEEIYPTEAFCRMPWSEGIVLRTKEGPMAQPNEWLWESHSSKGCLPYLRVTETHGDSVVTLPADSQVLAISDTCVNEIYMCGSNMLAFQSHPEFTYEDQLLHKVIPYVYPERMDDEDRIMADDSFSRPLHSDALIEVTRRFMKREYREVASMFIPGMGGPDEAEYEETREKEREAREREARAEAEAEEAAAAEAAAYASAGEGRAVEYGIPLASPPRGHALVHRGRGIDGPASAAAGARPQRPSESPRQHAQQLSPSEYPTPAEATAAAAAAEREGASGISTPVGIGAGAAGEAVSELEVERADAVELGVEPEEGLELIPDHVRERLHSYMHLDEDFEGSGITGGSEQQHVHHDYARCPGLGSHREKEGAFGGISAGGKGAGTAGAGVGPAGGGAGTSTAASSRAH